jgi:hypothetical protein
MFARVRATSNAGACCFASVANPFICSILACYKLFEKEFKAVEANAVIKQEQFKVLTSEVAKYQHHLMMEKEKMRNFARWWPIWRHSWRRRRPRYRC